MELIASWKHIFFRCIVERDRHLYFAGPTTHLPQEARSQKTSMHTETTGKGGRGTRAKELRGA